jgi:hypothetical protein
MIKSKLKLNKNGTPVVTQKIIIECDDCSKEREIPMYYQIEGFEKYKRDLCRGCKQKEQVKMGLRKEQYIRAGLSSIKNMKGKTHIELYGIEKAMKMRQQNSDANSGKNNANYGGTWHGINPGIEQKGKTYEQIHGIEKATIIKEKIARFSRGENNPMYGKPSPNGSGNGWCGWYKGWHFRSLMELSFMINVIERFGFKWKTAESKKYMVSYVDYNGKKRNYFSDFILDEKYMVEIKPIHLINSITNRKKKEYAIEFCNQNNLKYKLITSVKKLTFNEIKTLVENNKIKFVDRYQIKFEKMLNENHIL